MAQPVYCPGCRCSNTFVRKPDKDIHTDSGKVFEEVWMCGTGYCGYIAYVFKGGEGGKDEPDTTNSK